MSQEMIEMAERILRYRYEHHEITAAQYEAALEDAYLAGTASNRR